ncbi:hypothetical protein N4Q66_25870, partial [Leclercia adecarboxylata]|uniref:hypothetical protein n=1 Tax=Leclercia adecarboxylata TaxID=83655 RepID=UPI00234C6375
GDMIADVGSGCGQEPKPKHWGVQQRKHASWVQNACFVGRARVVPAAGRQPLEMCPGALQAGIDSL